MAPALHAYILMLIMSSSMARLANQINNFPDRKPNINRQENPSSDFETEVMNDMPKLDMYNLCKTLCSNNTLPDGGLSFYMEYFGMVKLQDGAFSPEGRDLISITLWDGTIGHISVAAFRGLHRLKDLQITSCGLKTAPSISLIGSTLQKLALHMNDILTIPSTYFQRALKLKVLSLGWNELEVLPHLCHIKDTIEEMSFSHNKISQVDCPSRLVLSSYV